MYDLLVKKEIAPVTRDQAQKLTLIVAVMTLGRPVTQAEIVETCGRVFWMRYEPVHGSDPFMPVVLGLGDEKTREWIGQVRRWLRHLENAPRVLAWYDEVEKWARTGEALLTGLCEYAKGLGLTEAEYQFLSINLWYLWATAGRGQ